MSSAAEQSLALHAERVLAEKSRSFHLASRFLPRAHRADAALLYTFCRAVDDAADDRADEASALAELDGLERELQGRAPRRPLVAAFVAMAERTGIDLRHAGELIAGVRSDVGPVRLADDGELLRYCYRVAGTVGLMMSPLLGVTDPRAPAFALDLGLAMQLTNIARDVAEDARLGRVYLPRTRLERAGLRPEALLAGGPVDRDAVAQVVAELLALAERYYRSADAGMRFIPLRPRAAILVASRVYRAIGRRLARRGGDALAGRTVVPPLGKLGAALGALAQLARTHGRFGWGASEHAPDLHTALGGLPGADGPARLGAGPERWEAG